MADDVIHILFVQNLPKRGITALEAFRPDPVTSEVHVVRERDALTYLTQAGPEPGLIVLDVELPSGVQSAIQRELRLSRRTSIPVVRLERTC